MMRRRCAHNIAPARRAGMTLIEVTVSIAMFSIVALALGSALTLASKALPDAKSASPSLLNATRVHDQIASELFYAQSVTEMTANAITFTVADRNSDGTPETIRYAWTGVAGDPLTRSYNGATAVTVLSDCREFALTFDKRAVKQPTTYTEQPEQQIYSSGKGLLGGGAEVNRTDFYGESLTANWSGTTAFWRVTRLRVFVKKRDPHDLRIQIRKQDASGNPGPIVVDQVVVASTSLPSSFATIDVAFTAAASLLPTEDICVVFRWADNSNHDHSAGEVWTNNLSLAIASGIKLVSSTNSGGAWSGNTLRAVAMTVWAAPSTKDADAYQYFLTDVRGTIRSGTDPAGRVAGVFNVATQPQVTGP